MICIDMQFCRFSHTIVLLHFCPRHILKLPRIDKSAQEEIGLQNSSLSTLIYKSSSHCLGLFVVRSALRVRGLAICPCASQRAQLASHRRLVKYDTLNSGNVFRHGSRMLQRKGPGIIGHGGSRRLILRGRRRGVSNRRQRSVCRRPPGSYQHTSGKHGHLHIQIGSIVVIN